LERQGAIVLAILLAAVLIAAVLVTGVPGPAMRGAGPGERPSITVPGEASIALKPDAAMLGLILTTEAETAQAAQSTARAKGQALAERLRDFATKSDVTLIETEINPAPGARFTARTAIVVKLASLERASQAADQVRGTDGVAVVFLEPAAVDVSGAREEAIESAVADARARASQVAEASGLKVKGVQSVRVLQISYPRADATSWSFRDAHLPRAFPAPMVMRVTVNVTFDAQ